MIEARTACSGGSSSKGTGPGSSERVRVAPPRVTIDNAARGADTVAALRRLEVPTMRDASEHALIPTLKRQLVERQIDRREFLRYATFLGMSAPAAYAFAGRIAGQPLVAPAAAQNLPRGGTLRLGMRCQDLRSPHTYSWIESATTPGPGDESLKVTGIANVTRPGLVEKWEASPDLKTWTLKVRRSVKRHNRRQVHADEGVWKPQHARGPKSRPAVGR